MIICYFNIMNSIIRRKNDFELVNQLLSIFPVTAILGPRQCGKTFLAKTFNSVARFDLENPRDLARLENPQLALEDLSGLIVLDEIQRKHEIFPLLRYLVDNKPDQKYLILGSASEDLIKQSSESLAGRVGYHYLSGLNIWDVGEDSWKKLWLRGGYPRAFLSENDQNAFIWIENYISTFLEKDIPLLGIKITANVLRRFWMMVSHYHGQVLNYSELGRSFGMSDVQCKYYISILEKTFMIQILQPWSVNLKKRLVKQPKLYICDSGIFHTLQSIKTDEQLLVNPRLGASWEGFGLETVLKSIGKNRNQVFFYSTHSGAELDLFWQHDGKNWGVEFKNSDSPTRTKSMQSVRQDLELEHLWVVYPGSEQYKIDSNITVLPLRKITCKWNYTNATNSASAICV